MLFSLEIQEIHLNLSILFKILLGKMGKIGTHPIWEK